MSIQWIGYSWSTEEIALNSIMGILLLIARVSRSYYSAVPQQSKESKFSVKFEKNRLREWIFLTILGLGMCVIIPWGMSLMSMFDFGQPLALRWVWLLPIALGTYIFSCSHRDLNIFWTPVLQISKGHQLITTRSYSWCRHPMYLGAFFMFPPIGLVLDNWLLFLTITIPWLMLFFQRIPNEEKLMIEEFGEEYREYQKNTPLFFPTLKSLF